MPPLERRESLNRPSPLGSESYSSSIHQRSLPLHKNSSTNAAKRKPCHNETFGIAPLRGDCTHCPILPKRHVLVGVDPISGYSSPDDSLHLSDDDDDSLTLNESGYGCDTNCSGDSRADILDIFSNMCLGAELNPRNRRRPSQSKSAIASNKKRVVYPIAKYPTRLNNPRLVYQRRKTLQEQLTFKPVRTKSMELSLREGIAATSTVSL